MPGKDFEQQVRETLGPWRIEPSDGTWGRLEEGLARKKKRRRAFYLFLLAGLLAGGALLLPDNAPYEPDHAAPAIASATQKPAPGASTGEKAGREASPQQAEAAGNRNPAATNNASSNRVAATTKSSSNSTSSTSAAATTNPSTNSTSSNSAAASINSAATSISVHGTTVIRSKETTVAGKAGPSRQVGLKTAQQASGGHGRSNARDAFPGDAVRLRMVMPGARSKDELAVNDKPIPIAENSRPTFSHLSYIAPFSAADTIAARAKGIGTTASTPLPAGQWQTDKYTRKKQWTFGLTAGAGRAAFTKGIGLSQAKAADLNAGPSTGSGVPPQGPSYEYRQDPSTGWEIGGWMRVPLSRKWSFSAGLSNIQFSTRTPVGQSLGDTSRSYYNGYTSQVSSNSFSAGSQSQYRNRYHLLQLPITADWQLNPGRKLPVTWTMGLAPGYLLSSNALVQDSALALYNHPDNQQRFQLGIRTGLRFRLMPSSAHPLDIGPVLQYQLNEVFVNGIRDNGHIYYLGVEARFPIFSLSQKQR